MAIYRRNASIIRHEKIGTEIFDLTIHFPEAAAEAVPGQFVCLYCKDGSRLLPRPISICDTEKEQGLIRMVYRIAGKGTREISGYKSGQMIEVMGPLGNGFTPNEEEAILIGGGIGIPPMLALAKSLAGVKKVVLGYRDETFLLKEFQEVCDTFVATEDGSLGTRGTVIDAMTEHGVSGKSIYACGPMPMLKAIAAFANEKGMYAQISLEERMACGIGACLGCICKTKDKNHHTNVGNARICKDGPVFDAKEVLFL